MPILPTLKQEKKLWAKGYHLVIGVDEVGRGALSGPVTAAAVALKDSCPEPRSVRIADSKQLRPPARLEAEEWIKKNFVAFSAASVDAGFIDRHGIVEATQRAMRRAIMHVLGETTGADAFVLADAFYVKYVRGIGLKNQKAIVKGDEKVFSIAAASIIAKTHRDKLMKRLSRKYPDYAWGRNKGYGTLEHREAIRQYGVTQYHRKTYLDNI